MKRMVAVWLVCLGVVFSFFGLDASASTNGFLDHFEWTLSGTNQRISVPFDVSIAAKDADGATVAGYTGAVQFVGMQMCTNGSAFAESFEKTDTPGWQMIPGSPFVATPTNEYSAVGWAILADDGKRYLP